MTSYSDSLVQQYLNKIKHIDLDCFIGKTIYDIDSDYLYRFILWQ